MSQFDGPIVVILPRNDISCFLAASLIRHIAQTRKCDLTYYIVDRVDRRTWPNANRINGKTWLYMLGDLPEMPVHTAAARGFGRFTSSQDKSVSALFWEMTTGMPVCYSPILYSFERVWSHSKYASPEDWGYRCILFKYTEIAVEKGMIEAIKQADRFIHQPYAEIVAASRKAYDTKVAEITALIADKPKFTLHVNEEVRSKCKLPETWQGLVVRFIDTTDVQVDTGFLSYLVSKEPDIDILIQHRQHKLNNNVLHKYYARSMKETDLLTWDILKGHPRAASGEAVGAGAPFSDIKWMESIDDMPLLDKLSLA